jgi:hypothetical protein
MALSGFSSATTVSSAVELGLNFQYIGIPLSYKHATINQHSTINQQPTKQTKACKDKQQQWREQIQRYRTTLLKKKVLDNY